MPFIRLFGRRRFIRKMIVFPFILGLIYIISRAIKNGHYMDNDSVGSYVKLATAYEPINTPAALTLKKNNPRAVITTTNVSIAIAIATAADTTYFRALTELVASVQYWEPGTQIAVYDLGLLPRQVSEVKSWCNVVLLSIPQYVPDYVLHSPLTQYAWKAPVISDAVHRFNTVLYIDAGSVVRGYLEPINKLLVEDGHFFVQGQDTDMSVLIHSDMLQYFNHSRSLFQDKPSFAGNVQGYVMDSRAEKTILAPLVNCSFTPACIAPPGAVLRNHRFDQSALSILIYTSGLNVQPHTEYLAASLAQLSKDAKQPSEKIVWVARSGSDDYKINMCPTVSSNAFKLKPKLYIR